MKFEKNESNWPLVIYKIEGDVNKKEDFDKFLNSWSEMYVKASETKQKFYLLLDTSEMGKVDSSYIFGFVQFLKQCKPLNVLWMVKTAIFVEKGSSKFILDFITSIYKPARPLKVFNKTHEEAFNWLLNEKSV